MYSVYLACAKMCGKKKILWYIYSRKIFLCVPTYKNCVGGPESARVKGALWVIIIDVCLYAGDTVPSGGYILR